MNLANEHDNSGSCHRGFTLVELLVSLAIITILSSLTLAGLNVARQRVKADSTELTIRKIHEVIMPHYERFLTRTFPAVRYDCAPYNDPTVVMPPTLAKPAGDIVKLLTKRRALALEIPDGWADLLDSGPTVGTPLNALNPAPPHTAIAKRLRSMTTTNPERQNALRSSGFSDAECLWAMVIRGGFADPGIVEHFREAEFGDKNRNGAPEFIDGWGNPIRFLRWAPAFVSRYQPAGTATMSHDAFDPGGRDPLAVKTLFPLVFSCGPDEQPDIMCRDAEGQFSYPRVAFDPYFVTRSPTGSTKRHLAIVDSAGGVRFELGRYAPSPQYPEPFGTPIAGRASDDVTNHAMSR
jgi:prepilin-type N-terminal cleavage/methylation domain-containing protein